MRVIRRAILIVVASFLLSMPAIRAATAERPPSHLDARILYRDGGAIPVVPRDVRSLAHGDPLRVGWERFAIDHGGGWTVYLDERTGLPTLLSGKGLAWLPDDGPSATTLDDADRAARKFLAENVSLLGSWSDLLELDPEASLKLGESRWQLVYRQRVDGVRVENARLDVHLVHGRMVLMGAENWGRPTTSGVPALDSGEARGRLESYLGDDAAGLIPAGEPQLTLLALAAEPRGVEPADWTGKRGEGIRQALVWRFLYDEAAAPIRWVGEVDARDGSIRAFYEGTQYSAIRGGVFPICPDGSCATGGCEIPGFPMPYADLTETGQPEGYGDDYGNLVCVDPGATFTTNLQGPYVRIADTCGAISVSGTCEGGADLGMKVGENCSVAPGSSPGNTSAARTTFYQVNRIAEAARFYDPVNTWLKNPVTVNVNIASSCNANWSGSVINMYGAGGRCSNTGENAGILVHEWGHGYDQNDGGGVDKPSEAYSDIVAILATHDSCMGRGMYNDGSTCTGYGDTCLTCTGFREFDWTKRQSNTPATPTGFVQTRCQTDSSGYAGPCRREPHCESYISSEAMYDLATRDLPASGMDQDSAWLLAERLWYLTRPGSGGNAYTCVLPSSNSCGTTSWYQRMRVADDDDGNLANGTPHAAALFAAFNRHKLACGLATDATNQSQTSCAAIAAPVVTRTMTPAGVQLGWSPVAGAAGYRVYRGELGCDRQQVPLASLGSGQTTYVDDSADSAAVRYYRVQAFGSNAVCASPVSACVSAPPGSRPVVKSYRVVDDGDSIPEPGETVQLPVTLTNWGADAAVSTTAGLTLVSPGDVRVLNPVATWPSIAPSGSAESVVPQLQVVVLDEAHCGDVLSLDLSGAATNSSPFSSSIRIPMGSRQKDFEETSIVPIPYLTTTPAIATWEIAEDQTIADLDITLDIFHQDPTQIIVELTSPQGTTVRLHDRGTGSGHGIETRFDRDTAPSGPGTMADFVGESTLGTWTLSVQDVDGSGVTTDGYIRTRSLNIMAAGGFGCTPQVCADPKPTAAPDLRMDRVVDGPQLDLVLSWSAVAGAGYHVLQSVDPSFASGVTLLGAPTTETTFTVQDGARTTPALTFFQVRAVNVCHQEGP